MRKTKKPWKDCPLRAVLSIHFDSQKELAQFLGVSEVTVVNIWKKPSNILKYTPRLQERGISPNLISELLKP